MIIPRLIFLNPFLKLFTYVVRKSIDRIKIRVTTLIVVEIIKEKIKCEIKPSFLIYF